MIYFLQDLLCKRPNLTGLELLEKSIPVLSFFYRPVFDDVSMNNCFDRFRSLAKAHYGVLERALTTTADVLQDCYGPSKVFKVRRFELDERMLTELKRATHEHVLVDSVLQAVVTGNVQPFRNLLLPSTKESVLNRVTTTLPESIQRDILADLLSYRASFGRLHLHSFGTLSNEMLSTLLLQSPNLQELVLDKCRSLHVGIIYAAAWFSVLQLSCYVLKKLSLVGLEIADFCDGGALTGVTGYRKPIVLRALRHLYIKDCSWLKSVHLTAPALKTASLEENGSCISVIFDAPLLESLQLHSMPSFGVS